MDRITLIRTLETICRVLPVGKLTKQVSEDTIVVFRNNPMNSLNNDICGWESFDIVLLVPESSIVGLDNLYNKVHDILIDIECIEFDFGGFTSENYDKSLNAYYRTMRVRFPSQLI